MRNIFTFAFSLALFLSACATDEAAAQPRQPMMPAFPTVPVLPGQMSAAGSMPFGISGLVMRVKNNVEPRGNGLSEPTLVTDITIDNVPAPPSPIYGRWGIPLQSEDRVSVPNCPNPYNCEHVIRATVWRTVSTFAPNGMPTLMRAGVFGCVEQTFFAGDSIVSLDVWHIVPCMQNTPFAAKTRSLPKKQLSLSSRSRKR